jgi:hypothetical protein
MKSVLTHLFVALVSAALAVFFTVNVLQWQFSRMGAWSYMMANYMMEARQQVDDWHGPDIIDPKLLVEFEDPDAQHDTRYESFHLSYMKEPRLDQLKLMADEFVLRISVFASFAPPFSIRISPDQGVYRTYFKIGEGTSGADARPIFFQSEAILSKGTVNKFRSEFSRSLICDPVTKNKVFVNENGQVRLEEHSDGSTWVLELKSEGKYCALRIWSPERGPYTQLLKSLARLRANRGEPEVFGFLLTLESQEMP